MDYWCCGCGEQGRGLDKFMEHIKSNPKVNHRKHCEDIEHASL